MEGQTAASVDSEFHAQTAMLKTKSSPGSDDEALRLPIRSAGATGTLG